MSDPKELAKALMARCQCEICCIYCEAAAALERLAEIALTPVNLDPTPSEWRAAAHFLGTLGLAPEGNRIIALVRLIRMVKAT